jgi:hypothetical protein
MMLRCLGMITFFWSKMVQDNNFFTKKNIKERKLSMHLPWQAATRSSLELQVLHNEYRVQDQFTEVLGQNQHNNKILLNYKMGQTSTRTQDLMPSTLGWRETENMKRLERYKRKRPKCSPWGAPWGAFHASALPEANKQPAKSLVWKIRNWV